LSFFHSMAIKKGSVVNCKHTGGGRLRVEDTHTENDELSYCEIFLIVPVCVW